MPLTQLAISRQPYPSLISLAVLLCTVLVHVDANAGRGHAEPVPEVTSDKAMAIHWVGHNFYHEDDFIVTHSHSEGCPNHGGHVANIYCGSNQLHPHWQHAVEEVYGCWHWWRNHSTSRRVTFNQYPNLEETWHQHHEILNITVIRPPTPPLGCNDLTVQPNLKRRKSGWHNEEGGANFLSMAEAYAYRDWVLRSLERHGRSPRTPGRPIAGKKHSTREPTLKIGILNRRGSRRILNPEMIYQAFVKHIPDLHIFTLDDAADLPFAQDQLLWVNQMDIIVTGHGAQLVNLVAAAPCTVVVELFPPQYFIPGFFGPMANALGLKVFGMYMGKDGYADTDPCCKDEEHCVKEARLRKITVPEEFLKFPPVLLKAKKECCAKTHCWASL